MHIANVHFTHTKSITLTAANWHLSFPEQKLLRVGQVKTSLQRVGLTSSPLLWRGTTYLRKRENGGFSRLANASKDDQREERKKHKCSPLLDVLSHLPPNFPTELHILTKSGPLKFKETGLAFAKLNSERETRSGLQ